LWTLLLTSDFSGQPHDGAGGWNTRYGQLGAEKLGSFAHESQPKVASIGMGHHPVYIEAFAIVTYLQLPFPIPSRILDNARGDPRTACA
jgi:hypothetical protein